MAWAGLQVGTRFTGPIAIIRNWTYCLFYVMAELWGSVVVSVLFWGFANQITTVEEASQFYPLFGLGANVALIFSGQAVKYFSLVSDMWRLLASIPGSWLMDCLLPACHRSVPTCPPGWTAGASP